MDFNIGQIVISKAGRDKGDCFIITEVIGEYIMLVDGYSRPLNNPKKKKIKHVQPTNTVIEAIKQAITTSGDIKNADFSAAIKTWRTKNS